MMEKKIINFSLTWFLIGAMGLLSMQSCTEHFNEINTNPYGIYNDELKIDYQNVGSFFVQAQQNIYAYSPAWVTQLQQNLNGDVYSGYMMPPTPFAGNINNMTYALVDGWNNFIWSTAYQNVMGPLGEMEREAGDEFPEFIAWGKVVRVEAMHRVSDVFGPIVYTQYGNTPTLYDCQDVAYQAFFDDLNAAIDVLTPLAAEEGSPFTTFDLVYGGDVTKWVQFANSLKLRLAIRISNVDPTLAKQQAESAINHPLGVIESNDGNFLVSSAAGATHPLNVIDNSWNDIRAGAPMAAYLNGYEDPRTTSYFEPSVDGGVIRGIRQGIDIAAKGDYQDISSALVDFGDVQLMTAAEVSFLRSEGALRGWNMGGTAQQFYEDGVQTSFDQYGAGSADTYLADNAKTAAEHIDPLNAANNITAGSDHLSTITIHWNEADGFDRSLERIITQKWIAMYPDGMEAWSEFRRTGYPKLYPVMVNNSGGAISTDDFIKRINFVSNQYSTNPDGVQSGITCLEAEDNGGTSLWWDVE